MGISLQKGQRISLAKKGDALSKLMVGLGWDEAAGAGDDFDCDAAVLMLSAEGKVAGKGSLIYFGNLESKCKSVIHQGDNLTGEGEGDDEQIMVELDKVPEDIHKLVFVVTIYKCAQRKQHFGMIANAFIRVVNLSDNQEMSRFNLTEDYSGMTALIVGEIYRHNDEWKFAAVGQGTTDTSLEEITKRYK